MGRTHNPVLLAVFGEIRPDGGYNRTSASGYTDSTLQPNPNTAVAVCIDEHDTAALQHPLNLVQRASLHPALSGLKSRNGRGRDRSRFGQFAYAEPKRHPRQLHLNWF